MGSGHLPAAFVSLPGLSLDEPAVLVLYLSAEQGESTVPVELLPEDCRLKLAALSCPVLGLLEPV